MTNRFTETPRYQRTSPKLVIRVTAEEKRELERVAERMRLTLSQLVRAALVAFGALPGTFQKALTEMTDEEKERYLEGEFFRDRKRKR